MKQSEENKLLALLYSNFQGKQKTVGDWLSLAEASKKLAEHYGSQQKLADLIGVSRELIRSTIKLADLPPEVKKLVRSRKLSHELAWRIGAIPGKRNQIKIANAIVNLGIHDAREVVFRYKQNPNLDIHDYIKKLTASKDKFEHITVFMVALNNDAHAILKERARRAGLSLERYVSRILENLTKNKEI
jgi:ParB-like chromosome segregation protein Spo0J